MGQRGLLIAVLIGVVVGFILYAGVRLLGF
jgi:hypothetical protein